MDIEIVAKNTTLTEAIEKAAKEAIEKAVKIQDNIVNVRLTVEKTNEPKNPFQVKTVLLSGDGEIVLHKKGEDVYKLINLTQNDLRRRIRKQKEKNSNH